MNDDNYNNKKETERLTRVALMCKPDKIAELIISECKKTAKKIESGDFAFVRFYLYETEYPDDWSEMGTQRISTGGYCPDMINLAGQNGREEFGEILSGLVRQYLKDEPIKITAEYDMFNFYIDAVYHSRDNLQ